jgi:hypothetical protein
VFGFKMRLDADNWRYVNEDFLAESMQGPVAITQYIFLGGFCTTVRQGPQLWPGVRRASADRAERPLEVDC